MIRLQITSHLKTKTCPFAMTIESGIYFLTREVSGFCPNKWPEQQLESCYQVRVLLPTPRAALCWVEIACHILICWAYWKHSCDHQIVRFLPWLDVLISNGICQACCHAAKGLESWINLAIAMHWRCFACKDNQPSHLLSSKRNEFEGVMKTNFYLCSVLQLESGLQILRPTGTERQIILMMKWAW